MKNKFFIAITFMLCFSLLSCQNSERERLIKETQFRAIEMFNKDSSNVLPFDSVSVKKISASKDSLSYYKDKVFIGSSVIVYE